MSTPQVKFALVLSATVLGVFSTACAAQSTATDKIIWVDKFETNDLKAYQIEGLVYWHKRFGGVMLAPKALMARSVAAGFVAEVRVDVDLPNELGGAFGKGRGLHVRIQGPLNVNSTTAYIGVDKGRLVLGVLEYPKAEFTLATGDDPGSGLWIMRVRLRYGVVQAKAWRKSNPEPEGWQITRYSGESGWEARSVGFHTGPDEGAYLGRVAVRGTKPATDLFLKPEKPDERDAVVGLLKQVASLRKQGNIANALEKACECVRLARKVFGHEHAFTAIAVNNLAATQHDAGNYADSLTSFEESLKLRRKTLPPDHPHIAISIEGIGAALGSLGKYEEAEKKYREVLAFRRQVFGDDHPETAIAWNNLGTSLSYQAEYPRALDCFKESLKIRQAIFGNEHPDVAKAHNNIGYQLFILSEYPEARTHMEKAVKIYRAVHEADFPNHPEIATAENNLGYLLKTMGRFAEATPHIENAVAMFTKAGGKNHPLRAAALSNLGLLAIESGDLITARSLFEEALDIRKKNLPPGHPEIAVSRMNLAIVLYNSGGEPNEVATEVTEAFKALKRLPPDHPFVAQALHNAAEMIGDADKTLMRDFLEGALEAKRRRFGDAHPETLLTINSLANYYMNIGEHAKAEKLLITVLPMCLSKLGPDAPLTNLIRHNLGANALGRGKPNEATDHLRLAVAGNTKIYGRQHSDTARSLNLLALALSAQGKREEALDAAAESAAIYATVARKFLVGTSESQHSAFLDAWRPEVRLFVALAAADPERLGKHGQALWTSVMDWKAASGRAMLDRLEALAVGETPTIAEKYRELQDCRQALVRDVMRGSGGEPIERYHTRLEGLRKKVDLLARDVAREVKGYAAVARIREAGPDEVSQNLPAGAVLIEFVYLDPIRSEVGALPKGVTTDAGYAALIVIAKPDRKPDIELTPLGLAGPIDETIHEWRVLIQNGKRDPNVEDRLRQAVWAPIAKRIPAETKRLFISPTSQIALIPFEGIWEGTDKEGTFLIEKYLISYCSSGRDLIPRPAPPRALGRPLVVADPDFDLMGSPAGTTAPKDRRPLPRPVSELAFRKNPPLFSRLEWFAVEADAVQKLLDAKFRATPAKTLRRADATEENTCGLHRPRLLYFVTHGSFLADQSTTTVLGGTPGPTPPPSPNAATAIATLRFGEDPRLRSFLCLSGYNKWKERAARGLSDGLLTAREVQEMDLWGTELVVTAACETGVGEDACGEGLMCLRRAFLQAGARTVVNSLWMVDDTKTAALMPRFLGLWLDGTPKAESLRRAQLEMIAKLREDEPKRRKGYQAPPLYWAAFVCHGLPE